MKSVARLLAALGLFAYLQPLSAQEPEKSVELKVIDLRPQEERDGVGLTELSGKCNKGVYRIADVASDPLKVEELRAELARQMGLASDEKTLVVLNWSIYYNKQAEHSGPKLSGVGMQGYGIPGKKKEKQQGSKCKREESAGGWYAAGDVTTTAPPLVSEFSGTFGGKPFNIRVVHSPRRTIEGKFMGAADDTQSLLETVHKTAEALATAIVQ
jgi:hypothetical protein